jgi:hypothetical protein
LGNVGGEEERKKMFCKMGRRPDDDGDHGIQQNNNNDDNGQSGVNAIKLFSFFRLIGYSVFTVNKQGILKRKVSLYC